MMNSRGVLRSVVRVSYTIIVIRNMETLEESPPHPRGGEGNY